MSQSMFARLAKKYGPPLHELSRRDILKAALATSAGLMLSNCMGQQDPFQGVGLGRRRVVVVGAGLAGLSCAYELRSHGYDVMVLEARRRVSGRVLTFDDLVPGKLVEGGGELIGMNHPMWWTYANKFKLHLRKIVEDPDADAPIVFEGRKLAPAEEEKIYQEMITAQIPLNNAARNVDADMPWKTPNAEALDTQSMGEWLQTAPVSDLTKKAIRAEYEGNEGVALEKMSCLAFLAMVKGAGVEKYWTDSETHRCAQGNQALATKFAEALGNRVRIGSAVVSVVTGNMRVMVTTENGERYTAEDVVLTVPPSVWHKIYFTPELPPALKPQMGIAVKYLAGVKRPYWQDKKWSAEASTDGDISMTWEATEGQPGPGSLLTCFSGGPAAAQARLGDAPDRDARYQREIEQIYPGYRENKTTSRFMDWPADPWVQATYSFGAPRMMQTIGPALYNGIDTLHFAGEHTCWAFPGYMEGALRSGVMAAKRLAERDKVAAVRAAPALSVPSLG